jgi:general secretion pathway protein A
MVMYDTFYGFSARPFQLTPDPRFWFESATHRTAMSYLGYGLAQGEGFIVITGEVGSGKTTLVGHVMNAIDPARLTAARLVSTQVADADLLRLVADAFDIAIPSAAKSDALAAIETFLHEEARAGRRTLLIVDEAQNLAVSALEELRMLSNFQLGETSLLQIFLLGQPEFRATLATPQLEQLRQRVIATHHLEAMLPEEIEPYLIHRLSMVGWAEDPVFAPSVYDELWHASAGIPRRINSIASRLLLHGAVEERHELDGEDVRAVVADMGLSPEELVVAPAASAPESQVEEVTAPVLHREPVLVMQPVADEPQTVVAPVAAVDLSEHDQRIADLEGQVAALRARAQLLENRCSEQDAAIRRVLGLMIEWVEDGKHPGHALQQGRAA